MRLAIFLAEESDEFDLADCLNEFAMAAQAVDFGLNYSIIFILKTAPLFAKQHVYPVYSVTEHPPFDRLFVARQSCYNGALNRTVVKWIQNQYRAKINIAGLFYGVNLLSDLGIQPDISVARYQQHAIQHYLANKGAHQPTRALNIKTQQSLPFALVQTIFVVEQYDALSHQYDAKEQMSFNLFEDGC